MTSKDWMTRFPVNTISRISSEYNLGRTLTHGSGHKGIDIAATTGDPVFSVFSGKVIQLSSDPNNKTGWGKYVLIDHQNGYYTVYAHLDEVLVTNGEEIDPSNLLVGKVGATGPNVTGPHLHFELHHGLNNRVNPRPYLAYFDLLPTDVYGESGNSKDILDGDHRDNKMWGYLGNDTLSGGSGNDILIGGSGNDQLNGGNDRDTASYADKDQPLNWDLLKSLSKVEDTFINIEKIEATRFNDFIHLGIGIYLADGGKGNDVLIANDQHDSRLFGNSGEDRLVSGARNDTLMGGMEEDTYIFSGDFGQDVVEDVGGKIILNNTQLKGKAKRINSSLEYELDSFRLARNALNPNALTIYGTGNNQITLSNFLSGMYAIELDETIKAPENPQQDPESGEPLQWPTFQLADIQLPPVAIPDLLSDMGVDLSNYLGPFGQIQLGKIQTDFHVDFSDLSTLSLSGNWLPKIQLDLPSANLPAIDWAELDKLFPEIKEDLLDAVQSMAGVIAQVGKDVLDTLFDTVGKYVLELVGKIVGAVVKAVVDTVVTAWVPVVNVISMVVNVIQQAQVVIDVVEDVREFVQTVIGIYQKLEEAIRPYKETVDKLRNEYDQIQQLIDSYQHKFDEVNHTLEGLKGSGDTFTKMMQLFVESLVHNDSFDHSGSPNGRHLIHYGGNDTVTGSSFDDYIVGPVLINAGDGNDTLVGGGTWQGSANSGIDGGAGSDLIFGESGTDTILGGDEDDTIYGGWDQDETGGSYKDGNNFAQDQADLVDGGNGHDRIFGGAGNDTLYGGSGNDLIQGGNDNDQLNGNGGDDRIEGGKGDDILWGGQGSDTLLGGEDNDTLQGGSGSDYLNGGGFGLDLLMGDAGNDTLVADGGETLIGGQGQDLFDFSLWKMPIFQGFRTWIYKNSGYYDITIRDFNPTEDTILLPKEWQTTSSTQDSHGLHLNNGLLTLHLEGRSSTDLSSLKNAGSDPDPISIRPMQVSRNLTSNQVYLGKGQTAQVLNNQIQIQDLNGQPHTILEVEGPSPLSMQLVKLASDKTLVVWETYGAKQDYTDIVNGTYAHSNYYRTHQVWGQFLNPDGSLVDSKIHLAERHLSPYASDNLEILTSADGGFQLVTDDYDLNPTMLKEGWISGYLGIKWMSFDADGIPIDTAKLGSIDPSSDNMFDDIRFPSSKFGYNQSIDIKDLVQVKDPITGNQNLIVGYTVLTKEAAHNTPWESQLHIAQAVSGSESFQFNKTLYHSNMTYDNLSILSLSDGFIGAVWTNTQHILFRLYDRFGNELQDATKTLKSVNGSIQNVSFQAFSSNSFVIDLQYRETGSNALKSYVDVFKVSQLQSQYFVLPNLGLGLQYILGKNANQGLSGGNAADSYNGDAGNDHILGNDGNDFLKAGTGMDTLLGGNGNDTLVSDAGENLLVGGTGMDIFKVVKGTANSQTFILDLNEEEGDKLDLSDWNIQSFSSLTPVSIADGDDQFVKINLDETHSLYFAFKDLGDFYRLSDNVLNLAVSNTDPIHQYVGGAAGGSVFGYDGPDYLWGGSGNDTMMGEAGDDTLLGGEGSNFLDGGAGNDLIYTGDATNIAYAGSGDDSIYGGDGTVNIPGSNFAELLFGDDGNDSIEGGGGADKLLGGIGDDTLVGGEGADFLFGEANNDVLEGGIDNDTLDGGEGDDILSTGEGANIARGGSGDDTIIGGDSILNISGENYAELLYGDDGNDWVEGGGGSDKLLGGNGNDTLKGGEGNDYLYGESGNNLLFGEAGNDSVYGGEDNDELHGGEGNDLLASGASNDTIYGETGNDTLIGEWGDDNLQGGDGNDLIKGGNDQDILGGENGNDSLYGEDGNDTLFGNAGDDFLSGGKGDDIVYGGTGLNYIDGEQGNDALYGGAGNDELHGREGNDSLMGESGNDSLTGGLGNDSLDGGEGNDLLYTGSGANIARGGSGDDTIIGGDETNNLPGENFAELLFGDDGNDSIEGGGGADKLLGGNGNDTLKGGEGNDYLYGESGNNLLFGEAGNDSVYGGEDRDELHGGEGDDLLASGASNDTIYGETGNDTLIGEWGDDNLQGGDGNDLIKGGNDQDILGGENGNDSLYGEDGNDTLFGNAGDDHLFGWIGNDSLTGGNGNDVLAGEEGQDTLIGDSGNDKLWGGNGNDSLDGGDGDDELGGYNGNDTLIGGTGNDTLYGEDGNDILYGGDGDDILKGFRHDDKLDGGAGNDILEIWDGNETLIGGEGADIFRVINIPWYTDRIVDFEINNPQEKIDISQLSGYFDSFRSLRQVMTQQGNDTILRYGAQGTIIIQGIRVEDLKKSHFIGGTEFERQHAPIPPFNQETVLEDTDILMNVLSPAIDVDGDAMMISAYTQGSNGKVEQVTGHNLKYTPNANYNGQDIVTYTIQDQWGASTTQTITITINPVNDAPILPHIQESMDEDGRLSITPLGQVTDAENHAVAITGVGQALHGQARVTEGLGSIIYTPDPNFYGEDHFSYTVTDELGAKSTEEITITVTPVNDAPVAVGTPAEQRHIHGGRTVIPIDAAWFQDEENTPLTYTIHTESEEAFHFNPATGELTVLEHATPGRHRVVVEASDGLHHAQVEIPVTVISQMGSSERDILSVSGFETSEYLSGGDGDDELKGGGDHDTLEGGSGNDTLIGGTGPTLHLGGDGEDYLILGDTPDKWPEGFHAWNVYSHDIASITGKNRIADMFNGGEGSDTLYLSHGDDAFFLHDFFTDHAGGNPQSVRVMDVEEIYGGRGDDVIDMTSDLFFVGGVTAYGEEGNDVIWGNEGDDLLHGGDGQDNVQGGDGNDTLYGNAGADILKGNNGTDHLIGGAGSDTLWGGDGEDVFVFKPEDFIHHPPPEDPLSLTNPTDSIIDFTQDQDRIDLSAFADLEYADLSFTFQEGHTLITDTHDQIHLDLIGQHHLTEMDFILQ